MPIIYLIILLLPGLHQSEFSWRLQVTQHGQFPITDYFKQPPGFTLLPRPDYVVSVFSQVPGIPLPETPLDMPIQGELVLPI